VNITYKEKIVIDRTIETLKKYDKLYYTEGTSPLTDDEYDAFKEGVRACEPDHPYFQSIGHEVVGDKVKLPYILGSLDKEKPDTIEKWFGKNPGKKMASAKLDGCLEENTFVETENGKMTIKDICESKYKGKIKSYNIYEKKEEWDYILNYKIQKNNDDWYEIEAENGYKIILTGDHKIYVKNLKCWRQIRDLDGTEDLLIRKT